MPLLFNLAIDLHSLLSTLRCERAGNKNDNKSRRLEKEANNNAFLDDLGGISKFGGNKERYDLHADSNPQFQSPERQRRMNDGGRNGQMTSGGGPFLVMDTPLSGRNNNSERAKPHKLDSSNNSGVSSFKGSAKNLKKSQNLNSSPRRVRKLTPNKSKKQTINNIDPFKKIAKSKSHNFTSLDSLFGLKDKSISFTDFGLLSKLGSIDHVVFDKTDTLVKKTAKVTMISTSSKLFKINTSRLNELYTDVKKNPSRYHKIDVFDEVMKKKEDENYSEKSQEFFNEVTGEYDPEIFEEDCDFKAMLQDIVEETPKYLSHRDDSGVPSKHSKQQSSDEMGLSAQKSSKIQPRNGIKKSTFQPINGRKKLLVSKNLYNSKFNSLGAGGSLPASRVNFDPRMQASYIHLINDLGQKEKKFREKLELGPNNRRAAIVSNFKVAGQASIQSESESSSDSSRNDDQFSQNGNHSSLYEEVIAVQPGKKHSMEDFLIDFYNKLEGLLELINCMAICHEAKVSSSGTLKYLRERESTMLGFCKQLGVTFQREDNSTNNHFYKKIIIKQDGKLSRLLNVAGLNSYTNRQRVSVVVNDPRKGRDSYTLYVCGSEQGMKGTLKLNHHDQNSYKRLLANFKNKGVKRLIFAKKELTKARGQSYVKTFQLIRKSKKDQSDNFEKLALEIEKDLDFLGCVGYKNDLMENAETLIKNLSKAGLNMSILTGDKLENTIPLVKTLHLSNTDFRDSSKFYSLRFASSVDAYKEINRYMETIYDKLREKKVESILLKEGKTSLGLRRDSQLKGVNSSLGKSSQERRSLQAINFSENPSYKARKTSYEDFDKLVREAEGMGAITSDSLKKTMLINGATMDLILGDDQLCSHFRFMLIFSRNVIGYNFKANHKAAVVKYLKEVKQESVLSIGDGFNDISMIHEANIGVQIFHPYVPLVFGDIIITDLLQISKLLLYWGKQSYTNCIMIVYHNIALCLQLNILQFFYLFESNFNGIIFSQTIMSIFVCLNLTLLGVICLFEIPYNLSILNKFPAIYMERVTIDYYWTGIVFWGVSILLLESSLMYLSNNFVYRHLISGSGQMISQTVLKTHASISMIGMVLIRFLISAHNTNIKLVIFTFCIFVTFVSILLICDYFLGLISFMEPMIIIFTSTTIASSFLGSLIIPSFVEWVSLHYIRYEVFFKAYKLIIKKFQAKDSKFFSRKGNTQIQKLFLDIIGNEQESGHYLLVQIKECYKNVPQFINQRLISILSLESTHHALGLHPFTCNFRERNNARRFGLFISKRQEGIAKSLISLSLLFIIVEYCLIILTQKDPDDSLFFSTGLPYSFTLLVVPLFAVTLRNRSHNTRIGLGVYCKVLMVVVALVKLLLVLLSSQKVDISFLVLSRFFCGPLILDYLWNAGFFIGTLVIQITSFIKIHFISQEVVDIDTLLYSTFQLEIRLLFGSFILHCFFLLQKQKV